MEILGIIVFNVVLYWRTLKNSIIVDDVEHYQHISRGYYGNNNLRDFVISIPRRFYGAGTFYTKKYGHQIFLDNAFTVSLHTIVGVMIYLALGVNQVSFWAAILYSANPINNQLSIWKNGRRYVVNILFVLGMVGLGVWGILLYPVTFAFQVTAFFAPIIIAKDHPWALLAIPALLAFGWKSISCKVKERLKIIRDEDRVKLTPKRLFIIIKYYGHYFFKMPLPGLCFMIYPTLHYWGITEKGNKDAYSYNWQFLRGILAIGISIAGLFCFKGNMVYLWLFMCASTLQWCAIIPVVQDLADRYASLPNVFMMFFVSYLAQTYCGSYGIAILIGMTAYYVANLLIVQRMYKNMGAYWDYHRYFNPQIPSPRKYEINHWILSKDPMKAWILAQEGLQYNPSEFIYLHQAAVCHRAVGEIDKARMFAQRAAENYYIGQKETQEPHIKAFLDSLNPSTIKPNIVHINPVILSRQQRRAEERRKLKI